MNGVFLINAHGQWRHHRRVSSPPPKAPGKVKGFAVLVEPPRDGKKHRKIVADAVLQAGQGKFAMDIHLAISEMSLSGSGNGVYPKIATFIGKMMNGSWVPYFSEMAMIRHQV